MKLAIVSTHPIQYYAPLFRLLHDRGILAIKVFYTWEKDASLYDKDFAKKVEWDIPLLEGYDYRFVPNDGSPRTDFRGVRNPGLIREIEEWGAEAVLVFGWNYHSHLKAMRHFSGRIPVMFRGDSTLLDEQPGLKKLARRLFLRWVYRNVDVALYVGSRNKDYFLAHGLREDRLAFAPHAIDNDRFCDREGQYAIKARQLRGELGVGSQDTLFLFVGKFQAKKDPDLLIRAFKRLEHSRSHLLLVGNGELEKQLREAAAGEKNIHFLPFQNQSNMPVIYRTGDVFCLPSRGPGETWGLAVNEAMACERPVLASDRCGCAADLVVNGQNGFTFASGEQDALMEKMSYFPDRPEMAEAMGRQSFAFIREWSFRNAATAIENATNQTKKRSDHDSR